LTNNTGQLAGGQFHNYMSATKVFGALLNSATSDPNAAAAFGAIKSSAEQAYRGASPMFATGALPDNWYDPAATTNWLQSQSLNSQQCCTSVAYESGKPKSLGWAESDFLDNDYGAVTTRVTSLN
jgi:hypothetical protein